MMTIYGIPNCDTIKKTLHWFKENKIDFKFHDYKKLPISKATLEFWVKTVGWEMLINKKGTTWRRLTKEQQQKIINAETAIALMMSNNSIIKRPVILYNEKLLVGFNETNFINHLK